MKLNIPEEVRIAMGLEEVLDVMDELVSDAPHREAHEEAKPLESVITKSSSETTETTDLPKARLGNLIVWSPDLNKSFGPFASRSKADAVALKLSLEHDKDYFIATIHHGYAKATRTVTTVTTTTVTTREGEILTTK